MLKGFDENGNFNNVKITEDGKVVVEGNVNVSNTNAIPVTGSVEVGNSSSSPVPVAIISGGSSVQETTLISNIMTVGTTSQTVSIGEVVTSIMVANYSDTATVSIVNGNDTFQIGANIALDLPINVSVTSLDISSNEANTQIQLVVKGVA